jgi:hypothetical protein
VGVFDVVTELGDILGVCSEQSSIVSVDVGLSPISDILPVSCVNRVWDRYKGLIGIYPVLYLVEWGEDIYNSSNIFAVPAPIPEYSFKGSVCVVRANSELEFGNIMSHKKFVNNLCACHRRSDSWLLRAFCGEGVYYIMPVKGEGV